MRFMCAKFFDKGCCPAGSESIVYDFLLIGPGFESRLSERQIRLWQCVMCETQD